MTFDRKCYDLAKVFVQDNPSIDFEYNVNALAEVIQETIDDWVTVQKGRAVDKEAASYRGPTDDRTLR